MFIWIEKNQSIAGFAVFMEPIIYWIIRMGRELINREITFKEVKYPL